MKKYDHTWLIAEWERMGRPEIERYSPTRDRWETEPHFMDRFQYRIKSKPSIDWDHVHADITAMASDYYGDSYLYYRAPKEFVRDKWCGASNGFPEIFASFTPGTCNWKDSLVMRPVFVEE